MSTLIYAVKGVIMDREEEILKIVQEIRDEQAKHHARWEETVRRSEQYQQQVKHDVAKAKRKSLLVIAVLLLILLGIYYLPMILRYRQFRCDFPVINYPAGTVKTPGFDGEYELDAERSFGHLHSVFPQESNEKKREFQQILTMMAEQFENFQIKNGVIRAGKNVIQEFRISSATISDGVLDGKALWHEDVYDPGDCCMMRVRLELNGNELEFSFSGEDQEPSDIIFLHKKL